MQTWKRNRWQDQLLHTVSCTNWGGVSCDPFRNSTLNCLQERLPLVDFAYGTEKCRGLYGFAPNKPPSLVSAFSKQHRVVLCWGQHLCPSSGTNYLPDLQKSSSQSIWATLLHEALHACASNHGVDHRGGGGEPRADRTCNEIAGCCLHQAINGLPSSEGKRHLPK